MDVKKCTSIRVKVVLISSAILFLAIGAMTLISSYIFSNAYSDLLTTNAYVIGQNLRMKLDMLLELGLQLDYLVNLDKYSAEILHEHPDISYVIIAGPEGQVFFHSFKEYIGKRLYSSEFINRVKQLDYLQNVVYYDGTRYYEAVLPIFEKQDNTNIAGRYSGIISIGYPEQVIRRKIRPVGFSSIVVSLISFVLSLTLLIFAMSIWITRPLTQLVRVIQQIKEKDNLNQQVAVNSTDEIGQLAETFNTMTQELERNRRLHIEKERLEKELEIAKMIQTTLLPGKRQLEDAAYDMAATMIPANEVGGDYYDIIRDSRGRLWIGIGDVTGHGVVSGLIMMMLQTAAFAYINQDPEITPAQLINQTNKVLFENMRKRMQLKRFMTLSFLCGNSKGEFDFAGKHLPVIIFRQASGKCDVINNQGFWGGILPDIADKTETVSFKLNKGDILFLYSDGILEAINNSRQIYGFERFLDSIQQHSPGMAKTAEEILNAIITDLFLYMDLQRDDISLLVIKKS